MAGITIKGDTSGEITLNVPATAGTNTITIPASSGTLAIQDGSGDLAVTNDISAGGAITASGNISTPTGTVTASSFSGDGSSLTGIAGGFSNIEVFNTPGTWTNPGNVQKVKVTVVAGGGGGGAAQYPVNPQAVSAHGGGAGGTAIEVISLPTATNVAVTRGAGGAGSNSYNSVGGTGGTSSFGSYCSATGGIGGGANLNSPANSSKGGNATGGNLNITGSAGLYAERSNTNAQYAGHGGSSYLAGGGYGYNWQGQAPTNQAGGAGQYGSGGGGATKAPGKTPASGGAGGAGVVIVEY